MDTKKGGKLVLDSDRVPIEIENWDKDVVQVLVEKRADVFTKEEASRPLADFELDLTVNDGGREIVLNGESSNSRRSNSLDVRFIIKVPMRYNIAVETGGGGINIGDLQGNVDAETSGGGIEVEFIAGGGDRHYTLETAGGDINISLPSDMKATVYAELRIQKRGWSSKDYDIYSDSKLDIDKKEGDLISARGKINGGGNMVRLRTTNGDINIEKR
ncbi:MAG: DUF4097 family beta strand repeat-containing protein [Candidatus Latescibacterota bacterium]